MDVSTDAVVGLLHVLTHEGEAVGRRQDREQLVLLRLVVEDLGLWLPEGQEESEPGGLEVVSRP